MKIILIVAIVVFSLTLSTPLFAQQASAELSLPETVFETLWQQFHNRYAIFEVRGVDWKALYRVYRPQVTAATTEEELFEILTALLGHLNDNHVILSGVSLGRDFCAGYLGQYLNEMGLAGAMQYLRQRPLPEHYFAQSAKLSEGGLFQYGWVADGIGYLHFGGFGDVAGSSAALDTVLAELSGAKGIIVDIRYNSGGDDRVGQALASRFADRKRLYMTTSVRTGPGPDDFASPTYFHVEPAGENVFTEPIILLQNRLSVSAAENFALAMGVLPHVTSVGNFTSGCFADMTWIDLPNGWRSSLAYNLFLDHTGRCWEGIGVPPDIMVRGEETPAETDPAFEMALALLQVGGPAPQNVSASVAAVRHSLAEKLGDDLETKSLEVARLTFDKACADLDGGAWYLSASELNGLGYRFLQANRPDEAVAAFECYVAAFPLDANAHDSLGEGYMNRGDREKAILSYERSLELDPGNENAVQMLARLRE